MQNQKKNEFDEFNEDIVYSTKKTIFTGLFLIVLFFGGVGMWTYFSDFQKAVIVPGKIDIKDSSQLVQHKYGGVVDKIKVDEGDNVSDGQTLVKLRDQEILSQKNILQTKLYGLLAKETRLQAEEQGKNNIEWPEKIVKMSKNLGIEKNIKNEKFIFVTNNQLLKNKVEIYKHNIQTSNKVIAGLDKQILLSKDIVTNLKEQVKTNKNLLDKGFSEMSMYMELQRNLKNEEKNLEKLQLQSKEAQQNIISAKLEITNVQQKRQQKISTELDEVYESIADIEENLIAVNDKVDRLNIKSPVAGTVVNLDVNTEGGTIKPGQVLMEIVPDDGNLIATVDIPPDKRSKIDVGDPVKIKLKNISDRHVKKIKGEISYVAEDLANNNEKNQKLYYLAHVKIDKDSIQSGSRLIPGMPLEIFVQTGTDTVFNYIMSPIFDNINKIFKQ